MRIGKPTLIMAQEQYNQNHFQNDILQLMNDKNINS